MGGWEIAASLHFLHHSEKMDQKESVDKVVAKNGTNFTKKQCDVIWKKLQNWGLVSA